MTFRQRTSDLAHRFGHWIDPAPHPGCTCRVASYMAGWRARRDAELRGIAAAKTPAQLDVELWVRKVIAESEAWEEAL